MHTVRVSVMTAVSMALMSAGAARAQEAGTEPGAVMEEIVVTAQKRVESAQDVPLSVAAFSGETLEKANVTTVLDLPRLVPNMMITRAAQTANVRLTIRGIGAAGNSAIDPSVGTFVDGIYVPRPGALFASFNDMAGVEVLRGPQGTLFGRNATVGGILFRTADPSDYFAASVEAQAGNYGKQRYTAMLNLPVGERLAFRLSGLYDSIDGWAKNELDGKTFGSRDTTAGRLAMKWDITDNLNWTVKVDSSKIGGDGVVEQEIDPNTLTPASRARLTLISGGNPPDLTDPFDRKSNQRIVGDLDDKQWGVASTFSWDLAGDYTIRLLSGYRDWENTQYESDTIYMPLDLVARTGGYESTSQSQELQLLSPVDQLFGGHLDFVAGLYYFQEDLFIGETLDLGANFCGLLPPAQRPLCNASQPKLAASDLNFNQDATNYAIYAQGNIGITDTLDFVLGGRWTKDEKDGSFVQAVANPFVIAARLRAPETTKLKLDDDEFTYRVGLNWRPNDDILAFASYSTGYKSGGFNSGAGSTALGQKRLFDKEDSENLEFGVKSTLADGRARLNATLFRMDLNDFQDRAFDGTSFNVINAGTLRQQGLELDGELLAADFVRLFGALGYLDSEFTKYPNASCLPYDAQVNPSCTQNLKGERASFSPEWSGSLGAQLEGDLGIGNLGYLFRTDVSYQGETGVSGITDGNPQNIQSSVTQLSARFSLLFGKDRDWSISVFGDNLTDEGFCATRFYQPLDTTMGLRDPVSKGTVVRCQLTPPRTYGVSLRAQF